MNHQQSNQPQSVNPANPADSHLVKDQPLDGKGRNPQRDGALEHLARHIDPPGREIDDEELRDPGKNIPSSPVVDNRS